MRSKKQILKDRNKRKLIKKEKQRLRVKKHKRTKYVIIQVTGLEVEIIDKLRVMAKQKHISVSKLISKLVKQYMETYNVSS